MIVLVGNCFYKHHEFEIAIEYSETTQYDAQIAEIVYAPKMRNTKSVRQMYQLVNQVGTKPIRFIRCENCLLFAEVRSMKRAIDVSKQGEEMIEEYLSVIEPILRDHDALQTLITFY